MSTSMTQDPATLRRGIDESNRRFQEAFNRGDAGAAAEEVYTRDARILPPGADIVQGRDNIRRFWKDTAQQLDVRQVELSTVDLQALGEGACEIGRAKLTFGNGQVGTGKYVVIWKQEDGRWRWAIDIWNLDA